MSFAGDPLAYYGKRIIEEIDATLLSQLPKLGLDVSDSLEISDDENRFLPQLEVGILGAGVGGLYTALIFDSLDIKYEILEASNRAGGRLSTYKFPNSGKYDYFVRFISLRIKLVDTHYILYLGRGSHALPTSKEG